MVSLSGEGGASSFNSLQTSNKQLTEWVCELGHNLNSKALGTIIKVELVLQKKESVLSSEKDAEALS